MIHKRTHLKIFYDELWAEHIRLSTGKIIKPFKDRHAFGQYQLDQGFKSVKPEIFKTLDNYFEEVYGKIVKTIDLITLADNRMMQGDYRYGSILSEQHVKYNVEKEFNRRKKIAYATKNLEYVIDAYNMLRIETFKRNGLLAPMFADFRSLLRSSYIQNWELISIDDGIHAEEN